MIRVNENYLKLQASWLFSEIAKKVSAFQSANPGMDIIKLGIGDVTRSLPRACIDALHHAVDEMADDTTFRGYGPDQGYEFLRQEIAENDFQARGADISPDEIFISDGAKCDAGNIQEIFAARTRVALPDPVYPVYLDSNVMAGRTGPANTDGKYEGIIYMPCTAENDFVPQIPDSKVDLIYLCFPNNPTGAVATKQQLKKWVDYARENKAVILFDAAYEAFISEPDIPHSIYEIDGSKEVAIEFRSFSKTAGFTGVRCAFTIVPKQLKAYTNAGKSVNINPLWNRRHCTKFNGVSYITQAGAAAVYTPKGKKQTRQIIDIYMNNAVKIRKSLTGLGFEVYGGINAPYIWLKTPNGQSSWDFFDMLLKKANIVGTPGSGFGAAGKGYFRLTAFARPEHVEQAMQRFAAVVE